jgi:hypothetical protein
VGKHLEIGQEVKCAYLLINSIITLLDSLTLIEAFHVKGVPLYLHRIPKPSQQTKQEEMNHESVSDTTTNFQHIPLWTQTAVVQTNPLRPNQPDDKYEQETDYMVVMFMRMPEPGLENKKDARHTCCKKQIKRYLKDQVPS